MPEKLPPEKSENGEENPNKEAAFRNLTGKLLSVSPEN
jgi:hypothetical protein